MAQLALDNPKRLRLPGMTSAAARVVPLDEVRPTALRVIRLVEAIFDGADADLVAVQNGGLWRAKPPTHGCDEVIARWLALVQDEPLWVPDTRDISAVHAPSVRHSSSVRFFASAPIRLRCGGRVGALRVFGPEPRAFDPALAARLEDLAALIAAQCDHLAGSDVRWVRDLFEGAPAFMAIVAGPDHRYEMINPAYQDFIGLRDVIGRPAREAVPDLAQQGFVELCDQVYRTGIPYVGRSVRVLVRRRADAEPEELFTDFAFQPLHDAAGDVWGIFCQGHEVPHEKLVTEAPAGSRAPGRGGQAEVYRRMLDGLSPRQTDVLRGVLAGKLNKTIAHELGISVRTVEGYRAEIMARTQARTLIELVRMSVLAAL